MYDNKSYGGFNIIKTVRENSYEEYAAEFRAALATGNYDVEKSFILDNGAYVLFEKGHIFHEDEIDVARALANHGIIVELQNEGNPSRATFIDAKGEPKFSEGTLSIEKLSFEQASKENFSEAYKGVKKALEHCKSKGSEIAVVYDKKGLFHKEDVSKGIIEYEKHENNMRHPFKAILLISKDKKVFEWRHNKK